MKYGDFAKQTAEEKQEVLQLGGLRIIGTERNEARRIDNQLRGRSGRQGDPGSSVFFISLEDEMIKAFGGEQLKRLSDMLDIPDDVVIASKIVSKSVERTQASVEDRNFSVRKNVLGYDDVMNTQRTIIYEQRNLILDDMDVHQQVLAMMRSVIERICNFYVNTKEDHSLWDYDGFNKALEDGVLKEGTQLVSEDYVSKVEDNSFDGLVDSITKVAIEQYEEKCKEADEILAENGETYTFSAFEKECMLYNVDKKWMDHIDAMDQLKQGIGLVAYAQRDPVMQYKIEGLDMFEKMVESIQDETVRVLVKSKLEKAPVKKEQTGEIYTNEHAKPKTERRQTRKIGPNEKCPCGSGKKYKYCCGK